MRKLKKILRAIFLLLVCRFLAHGIVKVENVAVITYSELRSSLVDQLARSSGYVSETELAAVAPDKYTLQDMVERYALHYGINPSMVRAKISIESKWNPRAISKAGAIGIMQVMPVNAKFCGLTPEELLEPEKNIICGLKIFSDDLKATEENVVKALYRYNGGPKAVDNPPPESRKHAILVLAKMVRDIRG